MKAVDSINSKARISKAKDIENKMVMCYNGVILAKEEKMLLALGPDFAMLDVVSSAQAARDFLIALTKIRWARMGKAENEINGITSLERKIK